MMTMVNTGLRIDVEERPRDSFVALRGELDCANAPALELALTALNPPPGATVEVDFGHLSFIGAAGIGAFAIAARELNARGYRLVVVRTTPFVRHLFRLSGLGFLAPEPGSPDVPRACRRQPKRPSRVASGRSAHPSQRSRVGA